MLIGAPLSSAAKAGLNLIDNQQSAGRVGQRARLGKELLRQRTDAALALDSLKQNAADFAGEFCAQVFNVVELDKLKTGNDGLKGRAIFLFVCCRDGSKGTAMEALFKRKKLRSNLLAFSAQNSSVRASQLERGLNGFAARVAKVDAVHAGDSGDALGQIGHLVVEVVVGCVDQRAALFGDCFLNHRAAVSQRVDADAAQQVKITIAILVDQMNALARHE